ncbi:MAG TPA: 6-phosphogluconolactonase [Candidatus Saccharimonadales bacterium]|nr:6-phosphogluconolactonase [Candidatus Saccharimonadales bacterium]
MHFVRVSEGTAAAQKLAAIINSVLAHGQRVTWLVSGGSAAQIAVEAQKHITLSDKLTVMQVDERYGAVGHADSNWKKLLDAGFDDKKFHCLPMLTGKSFTDTVYDYQAAMVAAYQQSGLVVGLFGIGADGHTAGILPNSAAFQAGSALVTGYHGPDFWRITITPAAITHLKAAIVYAIGADKRNALQGLQIDKSPVAEPAQLLKQIPEIWLYNDQIGDVR